MEFQTVIGLEIHAQLSTKTKIFCSCSTSFGNKPNTNTCPVCLGLPGALPVLNKHAVDLAIMLALALDCTVQTESIWDRKNYFYQDLPKGYQITQFAKPYCLNGKLNIETSNGNKTIRINRIHMEEDAGKSLHDHAADNFTCVDLNRAGVPLCEIVSEPDLNSPEEAGSYLRAIRSIVRYTGVCDGNMEQGSLRCDANVSIKPFNAEKLGTKVEIKNLNSIKFVEKALHYEIQRQKALIADRQSIIQETRLFDSDKGVTLPMRSKEDAHDYRYFPDPDLVPLIINKNWIDAIQNNLPELAPDKIMRFITDFQIPEYDAQVLASEKELADFFEQRVAHHNQPKQIANWIMTELLRELNRDEKSIADCLIKPKQLAQLIELIDDNTISGKMAKNIFNDMYTTGQDPQNIVKEQNLAQIIDEASIKKIIEDIIAKNPTQHADYKSGKEKLFGFFVGQVMQAMQGQAHPQIVNRLLKELL